MLHQRYKDFCFLLIAKATWPNYWIKRLGYAARSRNGHRLDLHLGSGTRYLPGFINIDANPLQKPISGLTCAVVFPSRPQVSIRSTPLT